ncbi:sensor histidine kinase [Planosporangium sp. 12N6]|uniref:sensor histidine kinase n=1 Tax=Planosporangium spinosum TaxID=3402278 RepID=UPI003CF82074
MSRFVGWRRAVRSHPSGVDLAVAVAVAALTIVVQVAGPPEERGHLTVTTVVLSLLAGAILVGRRRWPLQVLVVAGVVAVVSVARGQARPAFVLATLIAIYTLALATDRATTWIAASVTAVMLAGAQMVFTEKSWLSPAVAGMIAWVCLAAAAGDAVRSRRAYVAAVEERARRAEESREEEARRRVVEERLRIARELHDVVAHHIAMINVQAGVATHVLRAQPEVAEQALGHIRQASRTVLEELSVMLSVMRQSGDSTAPTEPAPSLARLDELVGTFHAAGLAVELELSGRPRPLPPTVDLAAYRVVQESLTNVHKHGGGAAARLAVGFAPDRLRIDIRNVGGAAAKAATGTGHGLLGMRERATAVGGTLTAGPTGAGDFRVHAVLPLPPEEPA